jgi:DNA-binding FrmR family transcriptional regulator
MLVIDSQDGKFKRVITRMRRIEGQARGIAKMLEEERYCVDILHQILAMEAATRAARTKVLEIHTKHCIDDALASDDRSDQAEKVTELLSLFEKIAR